MRRYLSICIVMTLVAGAASHAQTPGSGNGIRYKWLDAQGHAHFSDNLSAEAMQYGFDKINDQGLVIERVPRQLTPQERAAASQLAGEQAKKRRMERDRIEADARMLQAYPDENTYKVSQQAALEALDQQIRAIRLNLQMQEKSLTDLLGRAADIERSQKTVPKFINDRIASQRSVVTGQQDTLQRQQSARTQLLREQSAQLAHYRQIKAAQVKSTP